jgi:hypothetical protein
VWLTGRAQLAASTNTRWCVAYCDGVALWLSAGQVRVDDRYCGLSLSGVGV